MTERRNEHDHRGALGLGKLPPGAGAGAIGKGIDMMKVLIVYYSTYGNVFKMAQLVAEGPARGDLRADGPIRLRQDDAPVDPRLLARAHRGSHRTPAGESAARPGRSRPLSGAGRHQRDEHAEHEALV